MPSETGVYYMHNKDGEIIFLGKSRNIKKRVNEHFTREGKRARRIQKETKKVSFERTGSELIAKLKAIEELLRNTPKYNTLQKIKGNASLNGSLPEDHDWYGKNVLIIDKGRELGERSAILIKAGEYKGLGFYNLNHQINNMPILESIITPMESNAYTTQILTSYFDQKKVLKIVELTE